MTTLTAHDAIAHAARTGAQLHKYADPTDGARAVSLDEAREIARVDASLIYCEAARCECGAWSGARCANALGADAVTVEYVPEDLRASHEAAGYASIKQARAGAERIRVAPECAADMVRTDGEWCAVVEAR